VTTLTTSTYTTGTTAVLPHTHTDFSYAWLETLQCMSAPQTQNMQISLLVLPF
jgi:non-ribosomal peptide synthetase component E (peptide arylation enzyme)